MKKYYKSVKNQAQIALLILIKGASMNGKLLDTCEHKR